MTASVVSTTTTTAATRTTHCCNACKTTRADLLRCATCKSVWYCSVKCQRRDWKNNHRRTCRPLGAWNELRQIITTTSHPNNVDYSQEMQKAQACVENVKREENEEKQRQARQQRLREQQKEVMKRKQVATDQLGSKRQERDEEASIKEVERVYTNETVSTTIPPPWKFYVEKLLNLNCIQITLRKHNNDNDDDKPASLLLDHMQVSCILESVHDSNSSSGHTKITVHNSKTNDKLSLRLTLVINEVPQVTEYGPEEYLVMRCNYIANDSSIVDESDEYIDSKKLTLEEVRNIACASCCQRLTADYNESKDKIQRLAPLPSGRWADMNDYLVCYPGQQVLDLTPSSMIAQRQCVWYNDTCLVYHVTDLHTSSTCVLAIDGFGEDCIDEDTAKISSNDNTTTPLDRGIRSWEPAIGGATVTCSRCCQPLGVVPAECVDTIRFWQTQVTTRLRADMQSALSLSQIRLNNSYKAGKSVQSMLKFVIQEMIRYADTHAIFNWRIECKSLSRQMLLYLISWQNPLSSWSSSSTTTTTTATTANTDEIVNGGERVHTLRLDVPSVKILYRTVDSSLSSASSLDNKNDVVASQSWRYIGDDWCCPPTVSSIGSHNNKTADSTTTKLYAKQQLSLPAALSTKTGFDASEVVFNLSELSFVELLHQLKDPERNNMFSKQAIEAAVASRIMTTNKEYIDSANDAGLCMISLSDV